MTMKKFAKLLFPLGICILMWGCEVEQTGEGSMPDVDVDAEAGNMPEYEVEQTEEGEMPDVDVSAESGDMPEYDVDTADVDVETEEKTVEVPVVDVDMPDEQDPESDVESER